MGGLQMSIELRSIYHSPIADTMPPSLSPKQYRKANRSPDEEFALRRSKTQKLNKFPQSIIALILQKQKFVTVTKNGINFEHVGTKYQYWSAESATCSNDVGKRVLVTFDPDATEFCHILTNDGRYVESIPQKGKVHWFDNAEMKEAMSAKAHALNRDMARFQEIHKTTTEQKARRIVSNHDKMQMVNTIAAPAAISQPTDSENSAESITPNTSRSVSADRLSFSRAEKVQQAVGIIRNHKAAAQERVSKTQSRIKDLKDETEDSFFGDRREEAASMERNDYAQADADISALDKIYG